MLVAGAAGDPPLFKARPQGKIPRITPLAIPFVIIAHEYRADQSMPCPIHNCPDSVALMNLAAITMHYRGTYIAFNLWGHPLPR